MQSKQSKKQSRLNQLLNETSSPCVKSLKQKKRPGKKLSEEQKTRKEERRIVDMAIAKHQQQIRDQVIWWKQTPTTKASTPKTMPKISIFRRILKRLTLSCRLLNKRWLPWDLLSACLPFFVMKRDQAEVAIEFHELVQRQYSGRGGLRSPKFGFLPDDEVSKREALAGKLRLVRESAAERNVA